LAFLRAGRESEATRFFRSAAAAREWPVRGIVDAPLAIAQHRQGKSAEASAMLRQSDQQIEDWFKEAVDFDNADRKLPSSFLAEALSLHCDATYELEGTWIDVRPQIEALRNAAIGKLDGTAK
jgi:hypothetical protein